MGENFDVLLWSVLTVGQLYVMDECKLFNRINVPFFLLVMHIRLVMQAICEQEHIRLVMQAICEHEHIQLVMQAMCEQEHIRLVMKAIYVNMSTFDWSCRQYM